MSKPEVLSEEVNVLVVGNNPTELGYVFDCLRKVPGKVIMTEIAFDLKSVFERLDRFKPNYILIDDNIGVEPLKNAVKALVKFRKTKSIPITVLKNSNYHADINSGVMNYVLKTGLTGESLYLELKNSLRFRMTQEFLYQVYKKRKKQILKLLK